MLGKGTINVLLITIICLNLRDKYHDEKTHLLFFTLNLLLF